MADKPSLDISCIRNLRLVYLYRMPYASHALPYFGMKVLLGKGDVLEYTHRDALFSTFVRKVHDTYQLEAVDGRNITLVGELTRSFLTKPFSLEGHQLIHIPDVIEDANHKYPLGDTFLETLLAPFLHRFLSKFVAIMEKCDIHDIHVQLQPGFNNRKCLIVEVGQRKWEIPMSLIKEGDNRYSAELLYPDAAYRRLLLRMHTGTEAVSLTFRMEGHRGIGGKMECMPRYMGTSLRLCEEFRLWEGEALLREETNLLPCVEATAEERDEALGYVAQCDAPFQPDSVAVYKIAPGLYFIDDLTGGQPDMESQQVTDINGLLVKTEKAVALKYTLVAFAYEKSLGLKQIMDAADVDCLMKVIETPDPERDYVVVQKYFNHCPNANSDYKSRLAGMYAGDIYKVPYGYTFEHGLSSLEKTMMPTDYKKRPFRL